MEFNGAEIPTRASRAEIDGLRKSHAVGGPGLDRALADAEPLGELFLGQQLNHGRTTPVVAHRVRGRMGKPSWPGFGSRSEPACRSL